MTDDPFAGQGERMYELGDKVVYPHHGAGTIVRKEIKEVLGQRREYLTIQILHNDMTVMVPTENADRAGLRKVIGEETVDEVIAVLCGEGTHMPNNWHRRFKHNREKIRTGDVFELAEVVRNLFIRDLDKGLSVGEQQMLGRAKKILASELMYARHVDAQEATELLEDLLAESGQLGVARSAIGHAANDHVDRALDGRPGIEPPSGRMASTRTDAPDYRLR